MSEESGSLLNQINTKLDVLISQHGAHAATISDHEARIRAGEAGHLETKAMVNELAKDVADHEQRLRSADRWRYALPVTAVAGVGSLLAGGAAMFTAMKGWP